MKETKYGKLLRPVGTIPANQKIKLEYYDGFWWAEERRIANSNIKFLD